MRNLLHRSQVGGTRDFHRLRKHNQAAGFGWPEVADIRRRDEIRAKTGLIPLSRMTMQAALLLGPMEPYERSVLKGAIPGNIYCGDDGLCFAKARMPQSILEGKGRSFR